ncbi:hypothetical protein BJ944DRAFT_239252 [Cunninghamella echinulata]|nr:hypothetical protein BJ944DRAFT_239252 [Cunninghamella echinulata]
MFQQFKSIFPEATVINIKSLANSVGLNEEELLSLGKEKFEVLRSEFQNLNNILANKPETNNSSNRNINSNTASEKVDINNTLQLFQRLEEGWKQIHDNNVLNIKRSQHANKLLLTLTSSCEQHNYVCKKMADVSTDFESIRHDINTVNNIATELKDKLNALDDLIDKTYLEYEEKKFEEWKQQEEIIFKEEKMEKERVLKAHEEQLKQKYQEHNDIQTKKRLELYDATFQADLEDYKRRRETEVSSLYSNKSMINDNLKAKLENINLDNTNANELDTFLSDSSMDNTSPQPKNKKKKDIKKNTAPSLSVEAFFSTGLTKPTYDKKQPIKNSNDTDDDDDDEGGNIEILGDEDYESE